MKWSSRNMAQYPIQCHPNWSDFRFLNFLWLCLICTPKRTLTHVHSNMHSIVIFLNCTQDWQNDNVKAENDWMWLADQSENGNRMKIWDESERWICLWNCLYHDFMWPDVLLPFQSNHLKSGPIISVTVSFQTSRDLHNSSYRWKVESIKCVLPEVEQSGWFSFYEFIFTQCISSVGKHKLQFYYRLIVIVLIA